MNERRHLEAELSAYLDGALDARERVEAETHLQACALCRARLEDLRQVSALIAALPEPAPRRSLVPHARVPPWLVPARWASSVAAAAFGLVFVFSSVQVPLAQPASAPAGRLESGAAQERDRQPPAAPAPSPPAPDAQKRSTARLATPSPGAAFFSEARPTAVARGLGPYDVSLTTNERQPPLTVPPLAWLVAAIASAAVALGTHRAIRRVRGS